MKGVVRPQGGILSLLTDENVQYLGKLPVVSYLYRKTPHDLLSADTSRSAMALVWLFSSQIPLAILPFSIYSVFHVATYTRSNLIPTIQPAAPNPTAPLAGASPSAKPAVKSNPLGDTIGKFVKEYYDTSMGLVALLEVALWFRLLISAITFAKGSWILLMVYTVFLRARYAQSSFVQNSVRQLGARIDAYVANQSTPPAVRQGWGSTKGLIKQAADATDLGRYMGGSGPGAKKAS